MLTAPAAPASAQRSEIAALRSCLRASTFDKYESFRQMLQAAPAARAGQPASGPEVEEGLAHLIALKSPAEPLEPPSSGLAPEEQAAKWRSLEAAEWLVAFQGGPTGEGSRLAPAELSPAAPRAGEPELAALVEGWVRRIALGGNSRRGVAHLDIGHGLYTGAQLVIAAERGHISIELTLPPGAPSSGLAERLRQRLGGRGYAAEVAVR
jgi:hypothetical protein